MYFRLQGLDSTKFSIEIHHGGFFAGSGMNLSYLDGKLAWFDNLDRTFFTKGVIDYMVQQLGYPASELVIVFWCPPGKAINEMKEVLFPAECDMMKAASVESKVLVLFVNHVERRKQHPEVQDNVCYNGCPELPPVVLSPSPTKTVRSEEGGNSDSSDSSEDSEDEAFECDSEGGADWYDSDYDMKEDDDLFAANVDNSEEDELVDKGKKVAAEHVYVPGSDDLKDDELELPVEDDSERRQKSDSDDEEYKKKKKKKQVIYKYTSFNSAGDMEDPKFRLGQIFCNVEQLRQAVTQYAVKNRAQIIKKRNNKKRYEAFCEADGCPWRIVAVKDNRTMTFLVKIFVGEHTCEKVEEVKELTAPFLAQKYVEMFRDNDRMTLRTFARKVRKKYNMEPSSTNSGELEKLHWPWCMETRSSSTLCFGSMGQSC